MSKQKCPIRTDSSSSTPLIHSKFQSCAELRNTFQSYYGRIKIQLVEFIIIYKRSLNSPHKKEVGFEKNLTLRVNDRIEKVTNWNTTTGLINGGICPGITGVTAHELQEFLSKSSLPNPFSPSDNSQFNIAIHYGLGGYEN